MFFPKIDKTLMVEEEKNRKNSIILTIRRGFFTNIRLLLEKSESDPNELFEANTPQPVSSALEPEIVDYSIFNDPPIISNLNLIIKSIYSFHGRTPLMFCASIEDETWAYGIAQNLLEKGAKLGLKDPNGLNALMYACIHSKKSLVNLYLNALGDFQLLTMDNFGNTALHMASLGHNESICKILCDVLVKYDINPLIDIQKNKLGHTPFDLCFLNGHKACIENYNRINEHFIAKQAKLNSSRIQTANKRLIFRTPSFLKNLIYYETSMNLDSMQQNSSVLCENFEITNKIDKTILSNIEDSPDYLIPQYPTQSMNKPRSAAYSSVSFRSSNKLSKTTPFSNSLEIYRNIYPYKENLIKVNPLVKNISIKEDTKKKLKPIFCQLRPLTGRKLFLTSKRPVLNARVNENTAEITKSSSTFKSILVKREKNEKSIFNEENFSNSHNNFKSVSFTNINSVSEFKTEIQLPNKIENLNKIEQATEISKNEDWRKRFCHIFESLENHNTESFRLGFQYSASTVEDLTPTHAHLPPHSNSYNNLSNKRLSVSTERRKSFASNGSSSINPRKTSISIES